MGIEINFLNLNKREKKNMKHSLYHNYYFTDKI